MLNLRICCIEFNYLTTSLNFSAIKKKIIIIEKNKLCNKDLEKLYEIFILKLN